MIAALTGMALCVIGTICASVGLTIELRGRYGARRAREEAVRRTRERSELKAELAEAVRNRAGTHCPTCGRFATELDSGLTLCRKHGIVLQAATGPIPITLVRAA